MLHLSQYFMERHGEQISAEIGLDPRNITLDPAAWATSMGVEAADGDTLSVTHRDIQRQRQEVRRAHGAPAPPPAHTLNRRPPRCAGPQPRRTAGGPAPGRRLALACGGAHVHHHLRRRGTHPQPGRLVVPGHRLARRCPPGQVGGRGRRVAPGRTAGLGGRAAALHRGATLATAAHLRIRAERGELRTAWELTVEFLALTHDDLTTYAPDLTHDWVPGETVLEFTV